MKKVTTLILLSTITLYSALSQVGIGTNNPHTSSVLEVNSANKGFLPPRLTSDSEVTNPTEGLMIYDLSDNCLNVYTSSTWVNLCSGTTQQPTTSVLTTVTNGGTFETDCSVFSNVKMMSYGNCTSINNNIVNEPDFQPRYDRFILTNDNKIYDAFGIVYDTNFVWRSQGQTSIAAATQISQIKVIEDVYPNKKWKQMHVSTGLISPSDMMCLVSEDGDIVNFQVTNPTITSATPQKYIRPLYGLSAIAHSTPANYRPHDRWNITTLVSPANASWKYIYPTGRAKHKSSPIFVDKMLAYNNTDNLWYVWGGNGATNGQSNYSSLSPFFAFRSSTSPAPNYSLQPLPATKLNELLSRNNTDLTDPTDLSSPMHGMYYYSKASSPLPNYPNRVAFLTKDSVLNLMDDNFNNIRISLPNPNDGKIIQFIPAENNTLYGVNTGKIFYLLTSKNRIYVAKVENLSFTGLDISNTTIAQPLTTNSNINNLKVERLFKTTKETGGRLYALVNNEIWLIDLNTSSMSYLDNTLEPIREPKHGSNRPSIDQIISYSPEGGDVPHFIFKDTTKNMVFRYRNFGNASSNSNNNMEFSSLENCYGRYPFNKVGLDGDSLSSNNYYLYNTCSRTFIPD